MLKLYFDDNSFDVEFTTENNKPYFTFLIRHLNNIHYMVINSSINDINGGDVVKYYSGLEEGTYLAEVYAQPVIISTRSIDIDAFNIVTFKRRYSLDLLATESIQQGQCMRNEDSKGFSEDSYCRCVVKVGAKGKVDNPYAICTSSVGRNSKECWSTYDFGTMPTGELRYYALKHGVQVAGKTDCEIANILNDWQYQKLEDM